MIRHFEEELDNLRNRLLEMSGLVEDSVHRSIQSLIEKDEVAAQQVFQNEARINRLEIQIDRASHQPSGTSSAHGDRPQVYYCRHQNQQ